jgi:hypothetical protein
MHLERISRRRALAALAALAVAPAAAAAEPSPPAGSGRYLIELLVFRQPGPAPVAMPAPAIAPSSTLAGRVIPLPDSEWQLGGLDAALSRGGYTLLAHSAWVAIVPPNGRTTAHLEDVLPADAPLAGAVALQRGQYLFLGVDLDFKPSDGSVAAGTVYSLRERRRIKFGERHYFDHPALGVIAQVAVARGAALEGG